jgi:hypothetical protein
LTHHHALARPSSNTQARVPSLLELLALVKCWLSAEAAQVELVQVTASLVMVVVLGVMFTILDLFFRLEH